MFIDYIFQIITLPLQIIRSSTIRPLQCKSQIVCIMYVTSYFLISAVKSGKWAWLAMDGDPIHTTAEEQCQHMMRILTSVCI